MSNYSHLPADARANFFVACKKREIDTSAPELALLLLFRRLRPMPTEDAFDILRQIFGKDHLGAVAGVWGSVMIGLDEAIDEASGWVLA